APHGPWTSVPKRMGKYTLELVDRYVVIPEVIIWIASEALPDSANTQPCSIVPNAFHNAAPFSSANRTTSLDCAFAAAYFAQRTLVNDVCNCAYIEVPAWPPVVTGERRDQRPRCLSPHGFALATVVPENSIPPGFAR